MISGSCSFNAPSSHPILSCSFSSCSVFRIRLFGILLRGIVTGCLQRRGRGGGGRTRYLCLFGSAGLLRFQIQIPELLSRAKPVNTVTSSAHSVLLRMVDETAEERLGGRGRRLGRGANTWGNTWG